MNGTLCKIDFTQVKKSKTRMKTDFFIAQWDFGAVPFRYGIIVTRKMGNAVKRNRIKRRLREAIRLVFQHDIYARLVIVAHKNVLTASFAHIVDYLKNIKEKILFRRGT